MDKFDMLNLPGKFFQIEKIYQEVCHETKNGEVFVSQRQKAI